MNPEKGRMKIAAVVLALVVVVAVVAVIAMPRDISVEKEGDGALSFEGEKSLRAFGSIDIGIEPAEGCTAAVYLDGEKVASDVSSYRYDAPFADFSKHEIKVVFERTAPQPDDKMTLTVDAGEGGTVDPAGATEFEKGASVTLSIEPKDGYVIDDIKIDGTSVAVCNVIDVMMDADRSVSVSFRAAGADDLSVDIAVDAQIEIVTTGADLDFGKIVPSGTVKVRPGASLKIAVILNAGYEISDFKVDGKSVGKVTEYTIEDIRSSVDVSISVVKKVDGFTIVASAGTGGKISPSGDVKVEKGKDASFTFSANSGYAVYEVIVDGKKIVTSGSYTFKNVSENHTIAVTFKYVGSGGGSGGGSVTPSKTLSNIEITKQPTKTIYWKDETFEAAGMEVKATYSDGSTRILSAGEYSTSPSVMDKETTKVIVSYGGKTCDVPVIVKYVENLEIERTDGRNWYKLGEIVTNDVLKVTAKISDGTEEVANDYTIAPNGPLSKEDNLSVTYRGYTKTVIISIYEFDSITADTEKKTYLVGDSFDKDSIIVEAIYKNCKGTGEQTEPVTDFEISPEKSDTAEPCAVTVTYMTKTCTLTLTIVDPKSISSIEVSGSTKTKYFDDTELDTAGLVITGTTTDGTKVDIPVGSVDISEGKADSNGKVTVTVTYNEKTATFNINRTLDINDLADLKHFRDKVNEGTSYSGKTITLKNDIDLKNEEWTSIGADDNKFEGTFNGKGKTISNLANTLFGIVSGTVSNVIIKDAEIYGSPIFIISGNATLSDLKFEGSLSTDSVLALQDACDYGQGKIIIKLNEGTYTPSKTYKSGNKTLSHIIQIGTGCEVEISPADGASKEKIIFDGQFKVTGKLTASDLVMKTSYATDDISQFSLSGVAVMNEGAFHANDVLFTMTATGDYTAITSWWSSGNGTIIDIKNSTFDCLGNRPIRSDGNVYVENCVFNDQYRYSIQMTSKASTMTCENATVSFKNNTIVAGTTTKNDVYGVQLSSSYGCSHLIIAGEGNSIDVGDTGKKAAMYYCDCQNIYHASIQWNTEVVPFHKGEVKIGSEDEFWSFANAVNSGDSYDGKIVTLQDDINLGYRDWVPINGFKGDFDGNGKTISGLKLDTSLNSNDRAGLFYVINSNKCVKNLKIDGVEATSGGRLGVLSNSIQGIVEDIEIRNVKVTTTDTGAWVGGLAAFLSWPAVKDVTIENIEVDATKGASFIAGFAPILQKNANFTFENCSVNGFKVNVAYSGKDECGVGGFVVQTQRGWEQPKMSDCHVTNIDIMATGKVDIGGFIAWPGAHTIAEKCTATGRIDAKGIDAGCAVGGFFSNLGWNCDLGQMGHKITDCMADVDIITMTASAGGFVGAATNSKGSSMYATFKDCKALGDVTCIGGGKASIGGFAGIADRGYYDSCSAKGVLRGDGDLGGFIGTVKHIDASYDSRYPVGTREYEVEQITIISCTGSDSLILIGYDDISNKERLARYHEVIIETA